MKDNYYCAVAYLYMGQQSDEQKKMGDRLGWYEEAAKRLAEASKLGQKESETVKEALKFANDVVAAKYVVRFGSVRLASMLAAFSMKRTGYS